MRVCVCVCVCLCVCWLADRERSSSSECRGLRVEASCPQLYQLVQQLGCTPRNARDGRLPDEELKGVMAVCTLLNARSARVEGTAVNDQSDAGRKGNRQTGISCTYMYDYAHIYTNHSKEYRTHRYTVHILHASGHDFAHSYGCMHELHCHMGPFACSDAAGKLGQ